MSDAQTIRAEIIATQRQFVADCRERLDHYSRVIMGQGWIVMPARLMMSLHFSIGADRMATDPRPVSLLSAHMFDRKDAERLAANCYNGNGEPARAVHICDALEMAIKDSEALIKQLEGLAG